MTNITEVFNKYKVAAGLAILIVSSTVGVISWSEEQTQNAILLERARNSLIHDDLYQTSRIEKKEIEIEIAAKELSSLLSQIGEDEPSFAEKKKIERLENKITSLYKEIEEIEVHLKENLNKH